MLKKPESYHAFRSLKHVLQVLLDEFIQSMARERWLSLQSKAAIDDPGAKTTSSLDPILSTLASLNDADDVSNRIQDLFELLDAQRQTGALRYQDLAEGLRKLEFDQVCFPPIIFALRRRVVARASCALAWPVRWRSSSGSVRVIGPDA